MSSRIVATAVVALACLSLLPHCAATSVLGRAPAKTAEELYERSMQDMKDGLYPEALAGFSELKTKFPYSKLAALADLRTADTHFERGKFLEAIDSYRQFLKFHPNHAEAAYATLRIGEAYREQIPSDWFFLPPSAEKDQANTRLAISAFRDVIARYPKSEHAETARRELEACRKRLADHEMYVAKFYWKRDKWAATAGRCEGVLRDYPGLGYDVEALWMAAQARLRLGDEEKARAHLQLLREKHADSEEAARAGELLSKLSQG